MIEPPETRYARCGELSIAYQCYGEGPDVMVVAPGMLAHNEAVWTTPAYARMCQRIAKFVRVVRFDRRGMGLSHRLPPGVIPSLDERAEDLIAVMDALELPKAVLHGTGDGGHLALFVAANYPERVRSLALYATWARLKPAPGYEPPLCVPDVSVRIDQVREHWGSDAAPFGLKWFAPSVSDDPQFRHTLARIQRLAAPPETAVAAYRAMCEVDIRALLPRIGVPTLVQHKTLERNIPIEHARYLAAHIPGARLAELPGTDHIGYYENYEQGLPLFEEFVTGRTSDQGPERPVASILFTDIVGSTSTAIAMGDVRWTDLLEEQEEAVRREIGVHGGRVVDTAGDGVFALFGAPGRAIHCAVAIQEMLRGLHLQVRAGIHTGEIEQRGDRVSGVAVHIGARIVASAQPGEILVSRTVKDIVAGSGFVFRDRGTHMLKGLPEPWQLFGVLRGQDA